MSLSHRGCGGGIASTALKTLKGNPLESGRVLGTAKHIASANGTPFDVLAFGGAGMNAQSHQDRLIDASRVNLREEYLVQYWTDRLGASRDEILRAVRSVGPSVAEVIADLARRQGSSSTD